MKVFIFVVTLLIIVTYLPLLSLGIALVIDTINDFLDKEEKGDGKKD